MDLYSRQVVKKKENTWRKLILWLFSFPEICEWNELSICALSWSVRKTLYPLTNSLLIYTENLKWWKGSPVLERECICVAKNQKNPTNQKSVSPVWLLNFFLTIAILMQIDVNCKWILLHYWNNDSHYNGAHNSPVNKK